MFAAIVKIVNKVWSHFVQWFQKKMYCVSIGKSRETHDGKQNLN